MCLCLRLVGFDDWLLDLVIVWVGLYYLVVVCVVWFGGFRLFGF